MIKSKKQLTKAIESLSSYDKLIESEEKALKERGAHEVEIELRMNALKAQKGKAELDIQEFKQLLKNNEILVQNIYELPKAIIKCRIKAGLTHKNLADKIEVLEQQIQRYEAMEYNKANLERVVQIINALEFDVSIVFKQKPNKEEGGVDFLLKPGYRLEDRKEEIERTNLLMLIGEEQCEQ